MSALDKIKNKLQATRGKSKEVGGAAVGDRSTEMEGRREQMGADLKDVGEQAKDAGGKMKDAMDH